MLNRNLPDEELIGLRQAQDDRGLRLLHQARAVRGLTAEQVRRIASRLDAPGAAVLPVRRRLMVPILAAFALLLFAGTALAWATGALQRVLPLRALVTSDRRSPLPVHPARAMTWPTRPSDEVGAAPPRAEPAVPDDAATSKAGQKLPATPAPGRPPARGSARVGRGEGELRESAGRAKIAAAAAPAVSPGERPVWDSPIAREGESLASVLRRWRRDHDGQAALTALDAHDRSFSGGQMALESRLLRAEILLFQRREHEALAILDGLPLAEQNLPRGRELLTARGELRIKAGRCVDGRADLAAIRGGSDALAERARNALTHCP